MATASIKKKLTIFSLTTGLLIGLLLAAGNYGLSVITSLSRDSFTAFKAYGYLAEARLGLRDSITQLHIAAKQLEDRKPFSAEELSIYIESIGDAIINFSAEAATIDEISSQTAPFSQSWELHKAKAEELLVNLDNPTASKALNNEIETVSAGLIEFDEKVLEFVDLVSPYSEKAFTEALGLRDMSITVSIIFLILAYTCLFFVSLHFFTMSNQLLISAHKVSVASSDINDLGEGVKDAFRNVVSASAESASSIQETVATLAQIRAMMNKALDFVTKTKDNSIRCEDGALEGLDEVEKLGSSIYNISDNQKLLNDKVNETTSRINDIKVIFNNIKSKTDLINDIVFQTKLLSFNASVEAARAGEHGKGFAIVAEEVGNLAKVSGQASKEIAEILKDSLITVDSLVNNINQDMSLIVEKGNEGVKSGLEQSEQCRQKLQFVTDTVHTVRDMMDQVAVTATEQAEGVENITVAMQEIDRATHINSDAAGKASENTDQLYVKSSELTDIVNYLTFLINGGDKNIEIPQQEKADYDEEDSGSDMGIELADLGNVPGADEFDNEDEDTSLNKAS